MTESGRTHAQGVDEIVEEMRQTFLEEAGDGLRALQLEIGEVRHDPNKLDGLVRNMRRLALFLQSQSSTLNLFLIGALGHRMEDYLANAKTYPPHVIDHIEQFTETALDLVEGRIPMDADASELVRKLPAKATFDIGDIEVRNVEVMLVMHHDTAAHFVERELQQCGYRTSVVSDTFAAIPLITRTKPDLVVVSAIMPDLSGIDLAVGLTSMPATRNIPVAVITSLNPDDEMLRLLPERVPKILKGPTFGDDLAEALDMLFLI